MTKLLLNKKLFSCSRESASFDRHRGTIAAQGSKPAIFSGQPVLHNSQPSIILDSSSSSNMNKLSTSFSEDLTLFVDPSAAAICLFLFTSLSRASILDSSSLILRRWFLSPDSNSPIRRCWFPQSSSRALIRSVNSSISCWSGSSVHNTITGQTAPRIIFASLSLDRIVHCALCGWGEVLVRAHAHRGAHKTPFL